MESPAFDRVRERYLDDDTYASLQNVMLLAPEAGDLIEGSGGLRKLRFRDAKRGIGDLTPRQVAALREYLKSELKVRSCN